MANPGLSYFRTEKGKNGISFSGFTYRYARTGADGALYWRCLLDSCNGRMKTDANKANPQICTQHRGHLPNDAEVTSRESRETLRTRAANETAPLAQIYREEQVRL